MLKAIIRSILRPSLLPVLLACGTLSLLTLSVRPLARSLFQDSAVVFGARPPAFIPSVVSAAQASFHEIEFANSLEADRCSSVSVGPHVLLTASHCLLSDAVVAVDGEQVNVRDLETDRNDHALLWVDITFPTWLPVVEHGLETANGDTLVMAVGRPAGSPYPITRFGRFDATVVEEDPDGQSRPEEWFALHAEHGDSGAGIVDIHGDIVGLITGGADREGCFSFDLNFSKEVLGRLN